MSLSLAGTVYQVQDLVKKICSASKLLSFFIKVKPFVRGTIASELVGACHGIKRSSQGYKFGGKISSCKYNHKFVACRLSMMQSKRANLKVNH
jgi:hypothetical protein